MRWRDSLIQTLNIMREEIGQVLLSWRFFILTILTIGFFMFSVFVNWNYPQKLTTDYGIIRALTGAYGIEEVVDYVSHYYLVQLSELLSGRLLLGIFSVTYMGFGLGMFIIMLVALQTCDNISGDRAQGTLLLFFSKPIRRSKLVLARFATFAVSAFILVLALHVIPMLLFASYILVPSGALLQGFSASFGLIIGGTLVLTAFLLAVASVTYLFSSLTDSSLLACLGSLLVTIIPSYVTAYIGTGWTRIDLEGCLFSAYSYAINYNSSSVSPWPSRGIGLNLPQPWMATLILLSFVAVPLLLACLITEFREFK